MHPNRRLFVAGALAGAAVLRSRPSSGDALPTVRVAASPNSDVAPLLWAMHTDMFTKSGLNVVFTPMATGSIISPAVVAGSLDIGYSALTSLINGHVHGIPFVTIAPAGMYRTTDPNGFILAAKDSPLKTGRDFAGKTIGSPSLGDVSALVSTAWVAQTGGDLSQVKVVEIPNTLAIAALADGRIDAFSAVDPWVTMALDSGKVRILAKAYDTIAPQFLISTWFATDAFVAKNRDLVTRFERVIRDATPAAYAHPAELIPLIAAFTNLAPAMISRTLKNLNALYLDPVIVQPMIDFLAKYRVIPKAFDARELISVAALTPAK
jgi:NitT/TauT family transport system substrate-binding protein